MRRCTEDFRFVVDKKEDLTAPKENRIEDRPVAGRQGDDGKHIGEAIPGPGGMDEAGRPASLDEPSRGSVLVFKPREPGRRILDRRRMDHRRFLKKILDAIMGKN